MRSSAIVSSVGALARFVRRPVVSVLGLAVVAVLYPAAAEAQNIREILRGVQELQRQRQPGNSQLIPPGNSGQQPRNKTFSNGNPNASGNQNQGQIGRDNFFGPQGGGRTQQPGRVINPGNRFPDNRFPGSRFSGDPRFGQPGRVVSPNTRFNPAFSEPPRAPQKTFSGLPIEIRCDPAAVGTCPYELITGSGSAFPYRISAGQTQNLRETTDWLIRYRPGTNAPQQTYRLRGGQTYEFRLQGSQWQVFLVP